MNDSTVINRLENLKKIREANNKTQLKVSMDLGVSQELISRYEVGTSFPQPNMLIKLANYFNCSVDYLLGLTDIQTPTKFLSKAKNVEEAEIINKYSNLTNDNKKVFNKFLDFLITNND